jgi:hypothetical protein
VAVAGERDTGRRRARLIAALVPAALAAVLLALAAGASRARWLPVAAFLAVAVAAVAYFWVGTSAQRRRAWRLRQTEVPFGVHLSEPLWMVLIIPFMATGLGALLAAVAAATGFPSVGVGVLFIFVVGGGFIPFAEFGVARRALMFESEGLRVFVLGGSFRVPWTAISHVDAIGPDHTQILHLHLTETSGILGSHEPDDPRLRARVDSYLHKRRGGGAELMLMPWTGGLDGPTLARTIHAARRGNGDRAN